MKYLTGCADLFRNGYTDVCQFTCEKANSARYAICGINIRRQTSGSQCDPPEEVNRRWLKAGRARREMRPHFEEIQAHYDLSDDFFGTVSGPVADLQLRVLRARRHDARRSADGQDRPRARQAGFAARHDAARRRLRLGFGDEARGREARRQRHRPDAEQEPVPSTARHFLEEIDTDRSRQVFLRGWEQFDEPVDRIISIEAFEAFPKTRYAAFFETCYRILPGDGRMVLQTIMGHPLKRWPEMGIPITMTDLRFMRFIAKEIFPGGAVPCDEDVVEFSAMQGSRWSRLQYLNEHYVRTLDTWAANLGGRSRRSDRRDVRTRSTSATCVT